MFLLISHSAIFSSTLYLVWMWNLSVYSFWYLLFKILNYYNSHRMRFYWFFFFLNIIYTVLVHTDIKISNNYRSNVNIGFVDLLILVPLHQNVNILINTRLLIFLLIQHFSKIYTHISYIVEEVVNIVHQFSVLHCGLFCWKLWPESSNMRSITGYVHPHIVQFLIPNILGELWMSVSNWIDLF